MSNNTTANTTSFLKLRLPVSGAANWGTIVNTNFRVIDKEMQGLNDYVKREVSGLYTLQPWFRLGELEAASVDYIEGADTSTTGNFPYVKLWGTYTDGRITDITCAVFLSKDHEDELSTLEGMVFPSATDLPDSSKYRCFFKTDAPSGTGLLTEIANYCAAYIVAFRDGNTDYTSQLQGSIVVKHSNNTLYNESISWILYPDVYRFWKPTWNASKPYQIVYERSNYIDYQKTSQYELNYPPIESAVVRKVNLDLTKKDQTTGEVTYTWTITNDDNDLTADDWHIEHRVFDQNNQYILVGGYYTITPGTGTELTCTYKIVAKYLSGAEYTVRFLIYGPHSAYQRGAYTGVPQQSSTSSAT